MPVMRPNTLPVETLLTLRQQLDDLPPRAPERHTLIGDTATLYGVSPATVYRALRDFYKPKLVGRTEVNLADYRPRKWSATVSS